MELLFLLVHGAKYRLASWQNCSLTSSLKIPGYLPLHLYLKESRFVVEYRVAPCCLPQKTLVKVKLKTAGDPYRDNFLLRCRPLCPVGP